LLPEIGEGIDSVEISEISVKSGDTVKVDDVILVLESEKATMEIPAEQAGIVQEIFVKAGDSVAPGTRIMTLDVAGADDPAPTVNDEQSAQPMPQPEETIPEKLPVIPDKMPAAAVPEQSVPAAPAGLSSSLPLASPAVRKFARELGCDISLVKGTGTKNRITKQDVQDFIKNALAGSHEVSDVDFSRWGEVESLPLNRIRRLTGTAMSRSWNSIPHVTQYDKTDITELLEFTRVLGQSGADDQAKISLLPFVIKALVQTLKAFPDFNSSLDSRGETLIRKKYYHIGIAVDTPAGLVVPVIKNADRLDLKSLNRALGDVSQRARARRLKPDELQGASFTVTSLGGIGGTWFSPIVNSPEVAILGISRYRTEAVWEKGQFVPRTLLPYSLSYDHRVIDGAWAARFTGQLGKLLENFTDIKDLNLI